MSTYVVLNERINQLRSIDKLVDISKSTIQIDIMLNLSKGEMTSAEIAKEIGQRRKAITDAMRKLRVKGIVDEVVDQENGKSSKYKLTASGLACLESLLEFTGSSSGHASLGLERKADDFGALGALPKENPVTINQPANSKVLTGSYNDLNSFPMAAVLSELIMILGTAKENIMTRKDLAKAVGLSEQRTESYLEVYLNGNPRLFRKYAESPKMTRLATQLGVPLKTRKTETVYGLTNEGLQYFYRMPSYARLKQSVVYKLLSKITRTSHPKSIFKRLTMMLCGGGALSVASLLLPFGYIASAIWLFSTLFVGAVTLLDAFMYNSV